MSLRRIATIGLCVFATLQAPALRAADGGRPDKVSFYFAAHEDDWQLFMNPSAFQDVINGAAKTVFIHMTAGDAGLGIGWGGRKHPFYLARENGAADRDPLHGRCRRYSHRRNRRAPALQRAFDLSRELSKHRELFPARAGRQSAGDRLLRHRFPVAQTPGRRRHRPALRRRRLDRLSRLERSDGDGAQRSSISNAAARPPFNSTSPSSMPASTRTTTPIT